MIRVWILLLLLLAGQLAAADNGRFSSSVEACVQRMQMLMNEGFPDISVMRKALREDYDYLTVFVSSLNLRLKCPSTADVSNSRDREAIAEIRRLYRLPSIVKVFDEVMTGVMGNGYLSENNGRSRYIYKSGEDHTLDSHILYIMLMAWTGPSFSNWDARLDVYADQISAYDQNLTRSALDYMDERSYLGKYYILQVLNYQNLLDSKSREMEERMDATNTMLIVAVILFLLSVVAPYFLYHRILGKRLKVLEQDYKGWQKEFKFEEESKRALMRSVQSYLSQEKAELAKEYTIQQSAD